MNTQASANRWIGKDMKNILLEALKATSEGVHV